MKIVHSKPRHPQSQGSVEKVNQDIENMVWAWMQDEQTNHWSDWLRFVQLMKNRAFHSGIKRTPYEALFGCKVKVGLTTSSLPQDVLQTIKSEEDLEKVLDSIETPEQHGEDDPKEDEVPFLSSTDRVTTQGEENKYSDVQTLESQQHSTSEVIACCLFERNHLCT